MNIEFDEEFQRELRKRLRKKELGASMGFACMLVLFSYFGSYCAFLIVSLLSGIFPVLNTPVASVICETVVYAVQLLVPFFVFIFVRRENIRSIFSLKELQSCEKEKLTVGRVLGYSVIAFSLSQIISVFSTFFTSIVSAVLQIFSKDYALNPEAFELPIPESIGTFAVNFVAVAILPAILEELVFRGVLLTEFLKYGKTFAITASAFFFASVHGSVEQMMYSFVFGLIFGYVAIKTGSLALGMIMHFLNNAYGCIVEYCGSIWNVDLFWTIISLVNFILILTGLVIVIIGLVRGTVGYEEKTDNQKPQEELTGYETFSVFVSPIMLVYYGVVLFETLYVYISYNL